MLLLNDMYNLFGIELFIRFTVRGFGKRFSNVCVCVCVFLTLLVLRVWGSDLTVSIPDHCLSIYLVRVASNVSLP